MKGVFCYRNLNRKGVVWSVRSNRTGRVIRRSTHVVLKNVEFKVSLAGRQRVLEQKRKNVHAGVKGTLLDEWTHEFLGQHNWTQVKYNPYKAGHFVDPQGEEVTRAALVVLRHDGCWAARIS